MNVKRLELALTSVDSRNNDVAELAAILHRNYAQRLVVAAGSRAWDDAMATAKQIRWLHPRAVSAAHEVIRTGKLDESLLHQVREDICAGLQPVPNRLHWSADSTAWCAQGVPRSPMNADPDSSIPPAHMDLVEQAASLLSEIWPSAYTEFEALIRGFVYVSSKELRSATDKSTFGAVYVGTLLPTDLERTFELLLHETAHHALYLRTAFGAFLLNPQAKTRHPLREDERPVEGTLHAAFVLLRMSEGTRRLARHRNDEELHRRADLHLGNAVRTIKAVDRVAKFTPRGRVFFEALTSAVSSDICSLTPPSDL